MKVRKGDTVKILSGKDRGKKAKAIRILPKESRLVVEGVNVKKKHRKSRRQDKKGEIILIPLPISVSAVQLVCPACGRATRVNIRKETGRTVRICKKCKKEF